MAYGTFTTFTGDYPKAVTHALSTKQRVIYVYLEYANDVGDIPEIDTAAAIEDQFGTPREYYAELPDSSNYARVVAIQDPVIIDSSVVDGLNVIHKSTINFIGQTSPSTVGMLSNGTSLNNSSVIYGAALVVAEDPNDPTKDKVLARAYFTDAPIERIAGTEASVSFPLTLSSTVTLS